MLLDLASMLNFVRGFDVIYPHLRTIIESDSVGDKVEAVIDAAVDISLLTSTTADDVVVDFINENPARREVLIDLVVRGLGVLGINDDPVVGPFGSPPSESDSQRLISELSEPANAAGVNVVTLVTVVQFVRQVIQVAPSVLDFLKSLRRS